MLNSDDWSFDDFKQHPDGLSFFLCVSEAGMETSFGPVRALFLCFELKVKCPGQPATGHKILAHIDEAHNLRRLQTLQTGMAALASAGCRLNLLVQSLAQLKEHYGEDGLNALLSGVTTQVWLDLRDPFSLETCKTFLGEKEVVVTNQSIATSKAIQAGSNQGTTDSKSITDTKGKNTGQGSHKSLATSDSASRNDSVNGSLLSWLFPSFIPRFLKTTWSISIGLTRGKSRTTGTNQSSGKSESKAVTAGTSEQHGTSESETDTLTGTLTEQRQVRPVMTVDEIAHRYSINNFEGEHLGLVIILGIGAFETERLMVHQHSQWYRQFGRDPEHPFEQSPLPEQLAMEQKIEAQYAPAAIAAAQQEINQYHARENFDLVPVSVKWGCAAAGLAFMGVGAPLLAVLAGAGTFACHRFQQSQHAEAVRISELEDRIAEAKRREHRS